MMWQCENCKYCSRDLDLIADLITTEFGARFGCVSCHDDVLHEHSNVIDEGWTELTKENIGNIVYYGELN